MTATQMYAAAFGLSVRFGSHRCFFCGGACTDDHRSADHRSGTFTGWSAVALPASPWCCGGCVAATDESDRSKRPRFNSWVVTPTRATPVSKGQTAELAAACLRPPAGPFAIVVAMSGQKHLLYRAPVNRSPDAVTVQFEEERVSFRPADLAARLSLCGRIAAAAGKPSLAGPPGSSMALALSAYWAEFEPLLDAWLPTWQGPLSRLAAYLSPTREVAQREYPTNVVAAAGPAAHVRRRRVPASAAGADGPGLFAGRD